MAKSLTMTSNSHLLSSIYNKKVEISEVKKEIIAIKLIFPSIKKKQAVQLDQLISLDELANMLREYSIVYPKEKLIKIFKFIEIPDALSFSLIDFEKYLNNCKILSYEMTSDDIISAFHQLKK